MEYKASYSSFFISMSLDQTNNELVISRRNDSIKRIKIKDIIEFTVFDESNIIFSWSIRKKQVYRQIINNRFSCDCLKLEILFHGEDDLFVLFDAPLLKGDSRQDDAFIKALSFLNLIVDVIQKSNNKLDEMLMKRLNEFETFKFEKFEIQYYGDIEKIRIFAENKYSNLIALNRITEYKLLDENRIVLCCKKGDSSPLSRIYDNRYKCSRLEFVLLYSDDYGKVNSFDLIVLENESRKSSTFQQSIDKIKCVFRKIQPELLASNSSNGFSDSNQTPSPNVISPYEKLLQLKNLYEAGIIDEETYEEKKKKLIDLL